MIIELSDQDIEVIRTSLQYSKARVAGVTETPPDVRKENVDRIETVLEKLRVASRSDG